MTAVYEELAEGTFEEYELAVANGDYQLAWQYLVNLALNSSDKPRVEALCYAGLATENIRLVSGILEALSILVRFRHRVDRVRLAAALETIDPNVRADEDVVEELEWLAGMLKERPES